MDLEVRGVERYGAQVMENTFMDKLRKEQCLCLNCKKMSDCETAKVLYYVCKKSNLAMAITRCPDWVRQ